MVDNIYNSNWQKNVYFSCLLRILDSFGTEPAFNLRSFAKQRKKLTSWGGQDLMPQQFFNMFRKSFNIYLSFFIVFENVCAMFYKFLTLFIMIHDMYILVKSFNHLEQFLPRKIKSNWNLFTRFHRFIIILCLIFST